MVSAEVRTNITKLGKALICGEKIPFEEAIKRPHLWRDIPVNLLSPDDKSRALIITDSELKLFNQALIVLEPELSVEHLNRKEIEQHLWYFVCKIGLNKKRFHKKTCLEDQVSEFISNICLAPADYEILVKIEDFKSDVEIISFWDYQLRRMSPADLRDYGLSERELKLPSFSSEETDNYLLIKQVGTNFNLVVQRAREEATKAEGLLRFYCSESLNYLEEQLLFRCAEFVVVKNLSLDSIGWSGKMNRRPYGCFVSEIQKGIIDQYSDEYKSFSKMEKSMKSAFIRAIQWYSTAIELEDYDLKVIALCTCLETVWCSKSDKKKGQAIAVRSSLAGLVLGENIFDPENILGLYELRSEIIHGNARSVTPKSAYSILQFICRKSLHQFLSVSLTGNFNSLGELHKSLVNSKQAEDFLSQRLVWGERSKSIFDELELLRQK